MVALHPSIPPLETLNSTNFPQAFFRFCGKKKIAHPSSLFFKFRENQTNLVPFLLFPLSNCTGMIFVPLLLSLGRVLKKWKQ